MAGDWMRRVLAVVAFGVLVVAPIVGIGLAETALPLSSDQALYSIIGQAIHHGAVPYRDLVDTKPPGIFYLRAVLDVAARGPDFWSGTCLNNPLHASCGWLLVKAADGAATLVFGLVLYGLGRALGFGAGAALASAGLGTTYVSLSSVSQMGLTPEQLAALLAAVAVLLALRARDGWLGWGLAGVAAGGAVLMKQPAATVLVPVMILAALGGRRPLLRGSTPTPLDKAPPPIFGGGGVKRLLPPLPETGSGGLGGCGSIAKRSGLRLGWVGVGVAVPLVIVGGVLAAQGGLGAAVEYTWRINLERIGTAGRLGGFGGDTAASATWQAFKNGLAVYWLLGGTGLLLAIGRLGRERSDASAACAGLLALVAWSVVDWLLLIRLREYVQLAPSVALLGGWSLARLWQAAAEPPHFGLGARWVARTFLVASLAAMSLLSNEYQVSIVARVANDRLLHGLTRSPDEFVADEVRTLPPGPLFVWGSGSELYLLTARPPAARSLNAITLSSNLPGARWRRAELMAELERSRPSVIVVTPEAQRPENGLAPNGFAAFQALLDQAYQPVDAVRRDAKYGGWQVYVRSGSS